jgi:hypothetical protein
LTHEQAVAHIRAAGKKPGTPGYPAKAFVAEVYALCGLNEREEKGLTASEKARRLDQLRGLGFDAGAFNFQEFVGTDDHAFDAVHFGQVARIGRRTVHGEDGRPFDLVAGRGGL